MTARFRPTPRAVADLDEIADYTFEERGAAQMEDYLRALNRRLEWLGLNPLAGRERDDVQPGYRSFPEGSHVVFYIVSDEYVDIVGIPHKLMDIGAGIF